jgi:polyisoprenyl-teichoic acid--peptidoglycan teichoic acid transferase
MRFVNRSMSPTSDSARRPRTARGALMVLILAISGLGCTLSLPAVLAPPSATPGVTVYLPPTWTVVPTQSSTDTPTPTATVTPTPGPTATPVDPWETFAPPTEQSAIDIPRPMPVIDQPASVVNIVIIGTDSRVSQGIARSDTLMVASLDKANGTVTLISIPRDLYVYIPGWRVDRINTADVHGRQELVETTILYNFGLRTDHYIRVQFSGFTQVIDTLGGIDVQVTGYLNDTCGGKRWNYTPGQYHMSGFTALCYVRMRYASSDFDRLRREQEVVQAIFKKGLSLYGLTRVPELFVQFGNMVQTDITVADALPLTSLAATINADPSRVHLYRVDQTMVTSYRVPSTGAAVLLPNREAILAMLQAAFGQ